MSVDHYSMEIAWDDQDHIFVVSVPELPGCMAHGETREEALAQAQVAIRNWISVARELRRPVPVPREITRAATP